MLIEWLGELVIAEVEMKDVYTICVPSMKKRNLSIGLEKAQESGVKNLLTVTSLTDIQGFATFACCCIWAVGRCCDLFDF